MFCSQCGTKLADNTKFCHNCGKENTNFSKNHSSQEVSKKEIDNVKDTFASIQQPPQKNTKDKKKNNWVLFSVILLIVLLINGRFILPDLIKLLDSFQAGNVAYISATVGGIAGWLLGSLFLVYIVYYGINKINFTNDAAKKSFISGLTVIIIIVGLIIFSFINRIGNNQKTNGSSLLSFANSVFTTKDCQQFFNYFQDGARKDQLIAALYDSNNHDWQKCNIELEKEQNDLGVVTYNEITISELQNYKIEYDVNTNQQPTNILLFACSACDSKKRLLLINYDPASGYKIFNTGTGTIK